MKIEKKHITIGLIAIVSLSLAYAYKTYKDIMDYDLGFKGLKVKKISLKEISFNVFLNFTNKSSQKIEIVEQTYKVYLNDKFVTDAVNYSKNIIEPKSDSVLGVDVTFDPAKVFQVLKVSFADLLLAPEKQVMKVVMNLKVKIFGLKFSIPYIYTVTIKELKDKITS